MKISASISRGHVAPRHDLREGKDLPENIDKSLSKDNVVLENNLQKKANGKTESIEDWINRRMQPAIDAYDATQKRRDRRIGENYGNYVNWHNAKNKHMGKPLDLAYEFVVQFGEHLETRYNEKTKQNEPVLDQNGNPMKSIGAVYFAADDAMKKAMREKLFVPEFRKALDHFKTKYPHLEIIQATCHFDESNGTPHMHLTIVPVGQKFKNGLQERVGFGHAIGNDGIERTKSRDDEGGFQMERMYDEMHSYLKERLRENEHFKVFEVKEDRKSTRLNSSHRL